MQVNLSIVQVNWSPLTLAVSPLARNSPSGDTLRYMTPTAEQMLAKLIAMFPVFATQWENNGDDWKNKDGSFRFWGLFAEFSRFVRDNFNQISEQKQKELMDFIESCVTDDDNDDVDNAVCTCFLENLAGEPPLSGQLRRYMGPKSEAFFNEWDYPRSALLAGSASSPSTCSLR